MNLQEIREEKTKRVNQLLEDCRMFFAFSNEQFEKNKTHLKEGEKYVHYSSGSYLPNTEIENYDLGYKEIEKWAAKAHIENNTKDAHILYELNNYECFYSGDLDMAKIVLPYSIADIQRVYHANKNNF
jgi:hypothetical protein